MTLGERLEAAELSQQIEAACLRAVRRALREVLEPHLEIHLSQEIHLSEEEARAALSEIEVFRTHTLAPA